MDARAGKGSAAVVAVVDGFGDADPDVEEAEAGDEAADGSVVEDGGEGGVGVDAGVVVPDAGPPGEDGDEDAEVDAEQDEDEEGEALEPDGGGGGARRGRGRWDRCGPGCGVGSGGLGKQM